MSSLNECKFIGNLGADPETRYLPSGDAVTSFSIACTEKWKDKSTGEQKESTEWIRLSAFGKLAEICGEYLKKGMKVYVSGALKTRKWTDQGGVDRYSTEIKIDKMIMLGDAKGGGSSDDGGGYSRSNAGSQSRGSNGGGNRSQGGNASGGTRQGNAPRHQGGGPSGGFDEMDDDIPFRQPYTGMQLLSCM